MALPNNRIKQIKLPDGNTYDVVPSILTDGTTSYALTSPTLTSDSTIALTSDIPSTYLKSAGVSGTFSNTLTISKQDDSTVTFYNYFHSPTYSTGLSIASGRGVNDLYVPEASTTGSGVMSASAQTFAGTKTFKTASSNSYGAVTPDTSSYTANKTLATTDLIVSAEFVEDVAQITIIGTGSDTTLGTSSIQVDVTNANTWNDLIGTVVGSYSIVEGFGNGISIGRSGSSIDTKNYDYVSTTQSYSDIVQPSTAIVPGTTYYLIYNGNNGGAGA